MSVSRPVIGITCCNRRSSGEMSQAVIDRYVRAAMRWADAAALLVPALPDLMQAREVIGRLDGLLLTGSPSNVEPRLYDESVENAPGPFDPGRDAMALGLIDAAIEQGRPVLGVCRGLQEINVAFGGSLARDLTPDAARHHAPDGASLADMFAHRHEVDLTPGGVLASALGRDRLNVNSVHFQGVGRLGAGLDVEARADDSRVEAMIAHATPAPVLAVQWHPEWDADQDEASQVVFQLFGRALRGDGLRLGSSPRP
jgi:putative glutamine amidotransferase